MGSKYEGYKVNGMRHGQGKFYYQDGGIINLIQECTMESGAVIECKDTENYIINQVNWLTRVSGLQISLQAMEFFITNNLSISIDRLTIEISTKLTNFGPNMKVH